MNIKSILAGVTGVGAALVAVSSPLVVSAQSSTQNIANDLCSAGGGCLFGGNLSGLSPIQFVTKVIQYAIPFIAAAAVVMFIYAALRFITDNGSGDGQKAGRTIVVNTIIGIVIALLAVTVVSFVFSLIQGLR